MTDQDHIDAMLAKLRERIPGLEWERDDKDKINGLWRYRGEVTDRTVIQFSWNGASWDYRTWPDIGYHGHPDGAIGNAIDSLRDQMNQIRSALKGAK